MSSLLSSQVAIIAGASRGIGLSIARLFTAEGASCLLVARSEPALRIAVRELEALKPQTTQPPGQEGSDILVEQKLQTGVEIRPGLGTELGERAVEEEIVVGTDQNGQQRFDYVVGEVGEESTWREVLKKEPHPTILVNAAGITHSSLLFKTDTALVREVLNTNLFGTIIGCKAVAKAMVRAKTQGCIINISSVYGIRGGKGATIYAASKAGVIGFSRALAVELAGSRIRVNTISPGYIDTDMLQPFIATVNAWQKLKQKAPVGRLGSPEEVAHMALMLVRNRFVNGTNFVIDGGLSAM